MIVEDRDIIIEPAYRDVIYVPAYDPCWVYGPWWYPTCSPLWFWYPGFVVRAGFFWGPRIVVGPTGFWCGFSWPRRSIFINVNKTVFINRVPAQRMHGGVERWQHDPGHRRGVAYRNRATAQRFGASTGGPGVEARRPFRGFTPEERGPIQVRPLTRPEMRRPGSPPSGVESQIPRQREAPPGRRGFEQPRGGPSGQIPGQQRGGGAFQGFGRSGIESRQQSERGRQSIGVGPRGGGTPGGISPSPGGSRGFGGGEFRESPRLVVEHLKAAVSEDPAVAGRKKDPAPARGLPEEAALAAVLGEAEAVAAEADKSLKRYGGEDRCPYLSMHARGDLKAI